MGYWAHPSVCPSPSNQNDRLWALRLFHTVRSSARSGLRLQTQRLTNEKLEGQKERFTSKKQILFRSLAEPVIVRNHVLTELLSELTYPAFAVNRKPRVPRRALQAQSGARNPRIQTAASSPVSLSTLFNTRSKACLEIPSSFAAVVFTPPASLIARSISSFS